MNPDILYVDDEPDNLAVFQASFEDDLNVLCVSDAQQALRVLESTPIPVVVADQRMPGMSGVELFEILRQKHPHVKRIILTGYIDASAMLDAINKGQAFFFLTKPWRREQLLAVLIRALEAHRLELANSALTDQLVASQRLVMLGHATARIAHEMSNQLCMLPLLEHIEASYATDRDLLQLAKLSRSMYERLTTLLDEVKAFVRSETREVAMDTLSLADAARELISFLAFDNQIDCSRLRLEIGSEPLVRGSKTKIQQVLCNLVKNAAFAIRGKENGQIRVVLSVDNGAALLVVEDNGCGISPQSKDRIWDPFFTTKGEEGNGLGLDICRELVHSHQGKITCESEIGKGSRFLVRLPQIAIPAAENSAAVAFPITQHPSACPCAVFTAVS